MTTGFTRRHFAFPFALLLLCAAAAAQAQHTYRQYRLEPADSGYRLALHEAETPSPGAGQVVVRVRAVSLNRRDIYMLGDQYGAPGSAAGGVPLSDGAGEVIAVGEGVSRFAVGDRVAGIFFETWLDGPPGDGWHGSARGGNPGGMLSEVIVSSEQSLVRVPEHLSWEEAATLPCAGVTAWVSLFKRGQLQPGEWVLLEGTGGVSVFGLIFAAAAGANPIITSSSDEKLARARELGAVGTVNYRKNADWQKEVRAITGGAGVSQVLEVGGQDTLPKALEALAWGGHIALIGGLSGFVTEMPVGPVMWSNATVSGIYVGSRADFEAMNAFISEHKIRPLVDKVFDFEDAAQAFATMDQSDFMGKIVIRL